MLNHVIGAVCSSLPVARSVRRLSYESPKGICVPDHVWAWIGYALFHPDSISSTWQELNLSHIQTSVDATSTLLSMAKGNNLLGLLNGTPAESTAYFRAALSPCSGIFHSTTVDAPLWTTPAEVSSLDVCVNSADIRSLEEWVPIVVPGVGLAYTNRRNVISIAARPPSTAYLRALQLHVSSESDPICRSLPRFLELLGPSLEHLSVRIENPGEHSALLKPAVMSRLLSRFPSLVSLSIHDNGELWNDDGRQLPQLKELELWIGQNREFVPFSDVATRISLRRLASLSLHRASSIAFEPSSIRRILDGIPSVQHLHCESGKPLPRRLKSYTRSRRMSKLRLGFSPILLSQRGRYALLSVVHRRASSPSAIGQLDIVLLKIVMEFAGDSVGPDVCIQDWREDSTCPIVANDIIMM